MFDITSVTQELKEFIRYPGRTEAIDCIEVVSTCKDLSYKSKFRCADYSEHSAIQKNEEEFTKILTALVVSGIIL